MTIQEPRIARVAVDVSLPHLDRLFDYTVPGGLDEVAVPGVRVKVRFAGQTLDGFVVERADHSERDGPLSPLVRVVSPEVVLTPSVARLLRAVADHYGGCFADVARLAVPPRHAATERAARPSYPEPLSEPVDGPLDDYPDGESYLDALRRGGRPRAAWTPVPVRDDLGDWIAGVVQASRATLDSGRGVLVVVPDHRDLDRLERAFASTFGKGSYARLTADLGPSARYRNFLAAARRHVRLVIGTRAAVFAPVANLGLIAVWDDGDDLHAEPRSPYFHVREVAALRAGLEQSGLLLAGYAMTAEVRQLADRGWLNPILADPREVRRAGPLVRVAADHDAALERDPLARVARLPHDVFSAIRRGLTQGPVLVQVPRAGYQVSLACRTCGGRARCPTCRQGLIKPTGEPEGVRCATCGPPLSAWRCPECGDRRLRVPVVGVERTAEEFGKAFPGVKIVHSSAGRMVDSVGEEPSLVLATPGAEPWPSHGYSAAVLLDTAALLARPDLRAEEEALRRWLAATALVRPAAEGGTVIAVGDPSARVLQGLIRLDAPGFAARERADRTEAGFPPSWKWLALEGPEAAVTLAVGEFSRRPGVEVLGPVPTEDPDVLRVVLRTTHPGAKRLQAEVKDFLAARSIRKAAPLRLRVDPHVI